MTYNFDALKTVHNILLFKVNLDYVIIARFYFLMKEVRLGATACACERWRLVRRIHCCSPLIQWKKIKADGQYSAG